MSPVGQIQLAGGRRLDLRVSGPSKGLPLVFHHGTPGASVPIRALEAAVHRRGLRLVTTSRPGYGTSDRQPGRRVVDVCSDTAAVLSEIAADRCLVAGWSGGGPHALACAARLDEAVGALVIASVAPFGANGLDWLAGMGADNVAEFTAALGGEGQLRAFLEILAPVMRVLTPEGISLALGSLVPEADQRVLTAEFAQDMAASFHAALLAGVDGWLDDDLAFCAPWGFDLAEIAIPTSIWQGSADLMVPFAHGQWLVGQLPGAASHLREGEGHFSIGIGAIDEMLDELVALSGVG